MTTSEIQKQFGGFYDFCKRAGIETQFDNATWKLLSIIEAYKQYEAWTGKARAVGEYLRSTTIEELENVIADKKAAIAVNSTSHLEVVP